MSQRLRHRGLRAFGIVAVILLVMAFWVLRPLRDTDFSTPGFTPMLDDALAKKYTPVFLPHALYGAPGRVFYRMARNAAGEIHIAYHPYYENEENPHPGFGAAMSRWIYTGGIRIKDIMFGPADIELVEVILDANGSVKLLSWEDAGDYNTRAFSVKHVPQTRERPVAPFCFITRSWNHMFALVKPEQCASVTALVPEYFSEAEWNKYRMVKKSEAMLRRNRMHRVYERSGVR